MDKRTLARRIAQKLGFLYIDTGAIDFVPGENAILLNGEDVTCAIREPGMGEAASKISPVPAVRRALVKCRRELGQQSSIVMEGRDIGTVVFPQADVRTRSGRNRGSCSCRARPNPKAWLR